MKQLNISKSKEGNCFEDGTNNIIYFPVTDSEDCPPEIRRKTEEIIDRIIYTHKLDTSKLHLDARISVFRNNNGIWSNEICIVISDYDTWIEEEYKIGSEDVLYEPFKVYLMEQVEKILFWC